MYRFALLLPLAMTVSSCATPVALAPYSPQAGEHKFFTLTRVDTSAFPKPLKECLRAGETHEAYYEDLDEDAIYVEWCPKSSQSDFRSFPFLMKISQDGKLLDNVVYTRGNANYWSRSTAFPIGEIGDQMFKPL